MTILGSSTASSEPDETDRGSVLARLRPDLLLHEIEFTRDWVPSGDCPDQAPSQGARVHVLPSVPDRQDLHFLKFGKVHVVAYRTPDLVTWAGRKREPDPTRDDAEVLRTLMEKVKALEAEVARQKSAISPMQSKATESRTTQQTVGALAASLASSDEAQETMDRLMRKARAKSRGRP